jgi:hypothetical protein
VDREPAPAGPDGHEQGATRAALASSSQRNALETLEAMVQTARDDSLIR